MVYSFLPRMMREFGIKDVSVAYYVGITASSLYMGRIFGSYFWGWLCDRTDCKKGLLLSLALLSGCTVAFGLSTSVAMAVSTRFLQGLLGGVIVALKSAVYSNCDDTNKGLGFAVVLGSYSVGLLLGPAIGGYLSFPADKYPNIFKRGSLFDRFPVFLPDLYAAISLAVSCVLVYFFVPTPKIRVKETDESALIEQKSSENGDLKNDEDQEQNYGSISVASFKQPKSNIFTSCLGSLRKSSLWVLLRSRDVWLSVTLYGVTSFSNTGFDELWPIFADSSRKYGGLNFTTSQIGTGILIAAIPSIFLIFLAAPIERRFGTKNIFLLCSNILIFLFPVFPFIGAIPERYVWFGVVPLLTLSRINVSLTFFSVNIFLNDSVEPQYIGAVNGLGMMISSIFRTISPVLLGKIYSALLKNHHKIGYPFNQFFPFVLCGLMALICSVLSVIASKKETTKERIDITRSLVESI